AAGPPAPLALGGHGGAPLPRARPRIGEQGGRDAVAPADNTAATHFAGIDVSKDTLDAGLLGPDGRTRQKRVANDPAGHGARLAWADRHAAGDTVHFCMEATGPDSEAIAPFLHAAGQPVSAANPAR